MLPCLFEDVVNLLSVALENKDLPHKREYH